MTNKCKNFLHGLLAWPLFWAIQLYPFEFQWQIQEHTHRHSWNSI